MVAPTSRWRVGAVAGTETTQYLGREHIAYQVFADAEAGLSALQKGRIDAVVYDRPLLLWLVNDRFSGSLQVLDATFDPQVYAIALPQGSELRIPIDLALLNAIRGELVAGDAVGLSRKQLRSVLRVPSGEFKRHSASRHRRPAFAVSTIAVKHPSPP